MESTLSCWKKKLIFLTRILELFVYATLPRCNAHRKKNMCENVIGTILNIPGKSKGGLKARKDLENLGIRSELAPKIYEKGNFFLPPFVRICQEMRKVIL